MLFYQWMILVLVKGGRDYIITQLAVYTAYIPGTRIYCLLGGYIIPTTLYQNQNNPMILGTATNEHHESSGRLNHQLDIYLPRSYQMILNELTAFHICLQ